MDENLICFCNDFLNLLLENDRWHNYIKGTIVESIKQDIKRAIFNTYNELNLSDCTNTDDKFIKLKILKSSVTGGYPIDAYLDTYIEYDLFIKALYAKFNLDYDRLYIGNTLANELMAYIYVVTPEFDEFFRLKDAYEQVIVFMPKDVEPAYIEYIKNKDKYPSHKEFISELLNSREYRKLLLETLEHLKHRLEERVFEYVDEQLKAWKKLIKNDIFVVKVGKRLCDFETRNFQAQLFILDEMLDVGANRAISLMAYEETPEDLIVYEFFSLFKDNEFLETVCAVYPYVEDEWEEITDYTVLDCRPVNVKPLNFKNFLRKVTDDNEDHRIMFAAKDICYVAEPHEELQFTPFPTIHDLPSLTS